MHLFHLVVPVTSDMVQALNRLNKLVDYNISIYLEGHKIEADMIDSLRGVVMAVLIACDEEHNGTKN